MRTIDRRSAWRRPGAGGAVIALTLLVAACGSYTKRDFVAQANGVCVKTVRETRLLAPPSFNRVSAVQARHSLAVYLSGVIPILRSEVAQLSRLRRPSQGPAGRAALDRYLEALRASVAGFGALRAAAAHGSAQGLVSAERALAALPVTSAAQAYGLTACATPQATIGAT